MDMMCILYVLCAHLAYAHMLPYEAGEKSAIFQYNHIQYSVFVADELVECTVEWCICH